MRLRLGRRSRFRVTGGQLIFSIVLGSAAGIYIWKPELERRYRTKVLPEELESERQKTLANFDTDTASKAVKA